MTQLELIGMNPAGQLCISLPGDVFNVVASVANTGNYNDLINLPVIPTQTSQLTNNSGFITSSNMNRTTAALNLGITGTGATGTQISATKASTVRLTYSTSVTITLGGSPISRVVLKYCATNSSTESDWTEMGRCSTAQPTTLSVTVGGVYSQEQQICGDVPLAWFIKAANTGSTGTHAEAWVSGQQTVYG